MDGRVAAGTYECRPGAAARKLPGGYQGRAVEATVLHQAVRGNLSSFLLECATGGGLPKFVAQDFERYLACGVLAHGFTRVACAACKDEVLVPFCCKSRGVCPSCNARRAHDTAIHLTEKVLPRVPFRQWTLSLPIQLRFLLARNAALLSEVLSVFVRRLFAFQRRAARSLGVDSPLVGAVAFLQRFGSALQLTPHFHVLLPEVVFEETVHGADPTVCPHLLRRPTDKEVVSLLRDVALRIVKLLRKKGKLEEEGDACDDALDFLRAQATRQRRLPLPQLEPARHGRRCAFLEGFSLHANTWVHENNREGLERLCNYGARGPLSLERLSVLPDGRLAYRMKRPSSSGQTVLSLTPLELLRRLAALIPPPRVNLVRFYGAFAPNARVRRLLVPTGTPPAEPIPKAPEPSPTSGKSTTPPTVTRVPWAELLKRTFGVDLISCGKCGGRRRVVACVFSSAITAEILEHLRLPARPLPRAPARAPPQAELFC